MIRATQDRNSPAPATRDESQPKHAMPGEPLEMLDYLARAIVQAEDLAGTVVGLSCTEFMPDADQAGRYLDHLQSLQRELKLQYAELAVIDPDPDDDQVLGVEAAMRRWRDLVAPMPMSSKQDPATAVA